MSFRKGLLAAAVAVMAMSGAASAGETKRVLGETEMDKVTAGVSFAFVINNQYLGIFGLADPAGETPIIETGETENVPLLFQVFDLNIRFPTTSTPTLSGASSRVSARSAR